MIKILKKQTLNFLKFIKRVLTFIQKNSLPQSKKKLSFEMYESEQLEKCYNHFKKYFSNSIFLDGEKIQEYAISKALKNDPEKKFTYLEFGVFKGGTINYFSKYVKKIYGFDSFQGLKEDWVGNENYPEKYFNLNKNIPKLRENVVPIIGWVQDTLEKFLEKENPEINFVHMDLDTYESTRFTLEKIKPYLKNNSIIIFDQIYNFVGWEVGEYKALSEIFDDKEFKFLAFCKDCCIAVIQVQK